MNSAEMKKTGVETENAGDEPNSPYLKNARKNNPGI